jgi:hypothetical protein
VFPARYELNSYIVFRKRLVSKRLSRPVSFRQRSELYNRFKVLVAMTMGIVIL